MASDTLDLRAILNPDQLAEEIAAKYDEWKHHRQSWESEKKELRDYLYGTDTSKTSNRKLPFKNSTATPVLSQIKMNLQANYTSHMFPNDEWINWEAGNNDAAVEDKRRAIESYIRTKARQQGLSDVLTNLIEDYIIYGNCFAQVEYVDETRETEDGENTAGYVGPKLKRISPHDIVFNPAASSFRKTPKIVRYLKSIGELKKEIQSNPDRAMINKDIIDNLIGVRKLAKSGGFLNGKKPHDRADVDKSQGFVADGFSDIFEYYNSELVEVLEFYGDFYDFENDELLENHVITVVDRAWVARKERIPSWNGSDYIHHVGWEKRPDNLIGKGPLDALIGMQYKIDKLENLRADVFDQIAMPVTVEKGAVDFYGVRGAPGGRYVVDEQGDVSFLRPDTTALNADLQINETIQKMELMAGSPREAMGIRSPGEKTKFEVQVLDNAANRIFRHRVNQFERLFIEPILNDMLELARRNINGADLVRLEDEVFGADIFLQVTREDLMGVGKLYPVGSRLAAQEATAVQNLTTLMANPALLQLISPHLSRKEMAKTIEGLIGAEKHKLVSDNIGIMEDVETQRLMQTAQQQLAAEAGVQEDVATEEEAALNEENASILPS